MSLINDALKRATQTQPPGSTPPAILKEPMRPAGPVQSAPGLPVYFVPVLLFVISGACFFLWKGWQTTNQNQVASNTIIARAREVSAPPEVEFDENIAIPANRVFSVEDDPAPALAVITPAEPEASTVPVEEPPKPPAPALKLQGIFYRPANPSAVVNNKTVFLGDFVGSSRVKAIDRQSVTLERDGVTQVLTLP